MLRTPIFKYVLGGLPFAVLFGLYNFYYFGSPFALAQEFVSTELAVAKTGTAGAWQTDWLAGLGGLLFSPSRGLFVYSPVFLFGVAGTILTWRNLRRFGPLAVVQAAALLVLGTTALWYDWWGGWSYGPRLLIDLGVVLALSMIPVLADIVGKRFLLALFLGSLLYSGTVQAVGAWSYDIVGWNDRNAEDVDRPEHRHRLWSVGDSQIKYYVEHYSQARRNKRRLIAEEFANQDPILVPDPAFGTP